MTPPISDRTDVGEAATPSGRGDKSTSRRDENVGSGRGSLVEMGLLWLLPAAALLAFVQLIPIAYAIRLSLYDKRSLAQSGTFVGLDNYVNFLNDPLFWKAAWTGTVYAVGSILIQLGLGLAIALILNQSFAGRGFGRTISLLPYMLPTATVALIFTFMANDMYGVINQTLLTLDLITEPILFFGSIDWSLTAVTLVAAWKWTPFAIIVLLARLQTIDPALYECARTEGAGPWKCFRDVTLPALRGTIFLIILLRGIWMFNKFDIPYLLTAGGPLGETTNLPVYAYEVTFLQQQQGAGSALAVIMCFLLLVVAMVYFVLFRPEREIEAE